MKLKDCEVGMKVAFYSSLKRKISVITSKGDTFVTIKHEKFGPMAVWPHQLRKIKEKKNPDTVWIDFDSDGISKGISHVKIESWTKFVESK